MVTIYFLKTLTVQYGIYLVDNIVCTSYNDAIYQKVSPPLNLSTIHDKDITIIIKYLSILYYIHKL